MIGMTMKPSLRSLLAALAFAGLAAAGPALAQSGGRDVPTVQRDARERLDLGLLGVWRADLDASTYLGAAPQEHLRSFQYTAEGLLMVTFFTRSATGEQSSGHWSLNLDGSPGYEYHSANGAAPYAVITLTMVDARTFNLTAGRWGSVHSTSVYSLSEDGQTLTVVRTSSAGESTVVYRRW